MPPDDKPRGRRNGKESATSRSKTTSTTSTPESISAQLRRRREAALRVPPLGDGAADPLDDLPLPVPKQRRGHVTEHRGEFDASGRLANCCVDGDTT